MNTSAPSTALPRAPYRFATSSVGRKVLMAVTGSVWLGFVLGHLVGNLQIFVGSDRLNAYAQMLQGLGPILWGIRLCIALFLGIHIWNGIRLWLENRGARPVGYCRTRHLEASLTSKTMIYTGLFVVVYLIYHLLHFTLLVTNPEFAGLHDASGRHDVYAMVVAGFSSPWVSGIYIIAIGCLGLHLSHAVLSLFQTMGWNHPDVEPKLKGLANGIAVLVVIGYVSIPLAVLTHLIGNPAGGQ